MSEQRIDSLDQQGRKLSAAFAEAESRESGRRRFGWRVLLPVAVVSACAAALLVGIGTGSGGRLTLDQAVAAVSKTIFDQPGASPNSVAYTMTRETLTGASGEKQVSTNETWDGGSATGYFRITPGDRTDPGWEAKLQGECHDGEVFRATFATGTGGQFEFEPGVEIPTDAHRLFERLVVNVHSEYGFSRLGKASDEEIARTLWIGVISVLQSGASDLTPAERSRLLVALSKLDGVKTAGRVDDPNGNPAIEFERETGGQLTRAFFDVNTGRVTYWESVDTDTPDGARVTRTYELIEYRHLKEMPKLKVSTPDVDQACIRALGGSGDGHYLRINREIRPR
jgi:hypothetical protein